MDFLLRPIGNEESAYHYLCTTTFFLLTEVSAGFINESLSPPVKNRSHPITANVEADGKTHSVIVAGDGYYSGYTLYVKYNIVT